MMECGAKGGKCVALLYNFDHCLPENGGHGLGLIARVEEVCELRALSLLRVSGEDIRNGVLDMEEVRRTAQC